MSAAARKRKRIGTAAVCFLAAGLAGLTALLVAGPAIADSGSPSASSTSSPADNYAVINATVNAATDHEVAGSSAFPNYVSGAVDNYYSMAHSHIDNSPFAEGTSSPADTGPLGQTAAAGNFSQPQYADARWPGSTDSGKATFGNQGGPYAVAGATAFDATATCTEASQGSSSGTTIAAPKGFARRLRLALAAWKATWLPKLGLKLQGGKIVKVRKLASLPITTPTVSVPSVTTPTVTTPTVSTPTVTVPSVGPGKKSHSGGSSSSSSSDGGSAVESTTSALVDPKSGAVVTTGDSSLGQVSLGSGQIVIDGIHVSLTITNSGTPTDQVSVQVGSATVGGVPVTIDQNGVQVSGQGAALPYQQADDALNSALLQAGVQITTVQPQIVKSTNELAVTAAGVDVKFSQPVGAPGVPAQYVEHFLGEVFSDSLATPAGPVPQLNLTGTGSKTAAGSGSGSTSSGGTSSGGGSGSGYSASSTGGPTPTTSTSTVTQATPTAFFGLVSKRTWFLLTWFIFQSIILGTGASLWYWRLGGATA